MCFLKQSEKLATLVNAAKVPNVESYWFGLFTKLAEKRNIGDLILNVGAGGGAPAAAAAPVGGAAGGAAAAAAPPPEEKKVSNGHFISKNDIVVFLSYHESLVWRQLMFITVTCVYFCYLQEEPKEESDDDMGFSLFD